MRLTHPVLELWHGNCKIFPSINKIAKILPSQEQKILVRRRISNDRWKEIEYFPLKYSQKCKGLKGEKQADMCRFLLFVTSYLAPVTSVNSGLFFTLLAMCYHPIGPTRSPFLSWPYFWP